MDPGIPYVEFVRGSACVPLSPPCRSTQYEVAHPTRTSDRVCRTPTACSSAQFETAPAESMYDRACANLTVCNNTAYESVAPTATSDRTCIAAPPRCMRGMSNGRATLSTNGVQRTEYCFSDGSTAGGDGSARASAGKSCYTIRHGHSVTADGTRWVYENDPNSPFQVFCDMVNCGGDTTNNWGNRSTCGGWTMVMKAASGSDCLNRVQSSRWRSTSTLGDATTRSNTCAKGPAYSRSTFTDVMIGSNRAGQTRRNVAFRFPGNPTASMYSVLRSCTRKTDGKLIVPGYGNPSQNQVRHCSPPHSAMVRKCLASVIVHALHGGLVVTTGLHGGLVVTTGLRVCLGSLTRLSLCAHGTVQAIVRPQTLHCYCWRFGRVSACALLEHCHAQLTQG